MTTMPNINAIITVLPTIDALPAVAATTVATVICDDLASRLRRTVVPVLHN
jgi:hypothetical protein